MDVIDSEFGVLQKEIQSSPDFQLIIRAHRNFLASLARMSLIDNNLVQEAIERIMQICLRFIAVCRLMHIAELGAQPATAGQY